MPDEQSAPRRPACSPRPRLLAGETAACRAGRSGGAAAAIAPDLGDIVGSSAVRAQPGPTPRNAEAARQQELLMREATLANLCLLVAGVLSGLVLVGPTVKRCSATLDRARDAGDRLRDAGAGRAGGDVQLSGPRERPTAPLARHARHGRDGPARSLPRDRAAGAAARARHGGRGLALIWRHLFEDQRQWLVAQAARHRRSSERTNLWGGIATALAFVGGSGAVIAGFQPQQSWMPLAGVVGAAIAAYALSREGLRRDRANADRYEKAAAALDQLAARLDPVADEVAAGRGEALPAFVEAITNQLEAEHKQWLDGVTQAEAALAKLDVRLRELADSRPKADAGGPTLVVAQPDRDLNR